MGIIVKAWIVILVPNKLTYIMFLKVCWQRVSAQYSLVLEVFVGIFSIYYLLL
jgi:hypothetical protein